MSGKKKIWRVMDGGPFHNVAQKIMEHEANGWEYRGMISQAVDANQASGIQLAPNPVVVMGYFPLMSKMVSVEEYNRERSGDALRP